MTKRIATSVCQQCGTSFDHRVRYGRKVKYCSRACSGAAQRKPYPEGYVEMACETCGTQFSYRPDKSARPRRYCSRACFGVGYSNAAQEARTKPCANCGEPFTPKVRTVSHCSRTCSNVNVQRRPTTKRACAICEKPYLPTSNRQRWCVDCTGNTAGRARLIRYGVSAPQWRWMVERFDGQCWICRAKPATALDHCHETGRVRGALCRTCNMVLHYVEHPNWWATAKAYLKGGDDHCAP